MTAINFKQIRQMQGLTLKEAASGICSIQMLSRWENGTGNMDFEKTLKLLERVNITSSEYVHLASLDDTDQLSAELQKAWEQKDHTLIKRIARNSLEEFHLTSNNLALNYGAIACSLYHCLTKVNLLEIDEQNALNKELSEITVWGQENISLFFNTIQVLSPKMIFQISAQLIENLDFAKQAGSDTFYFATTTLFEAVIALLISNNSAYAANILRQLNHFDFPQRETMLIIGRKFLNSLIDWQEPQNEQSILKIIDFLLDMGLTMQAKNFLQVYKTVRKVKN
ncbi:helix-turn-helix transcriptional regulator [Lactobacillus delbrueckii subsp. allosunkii]|jgi:transcriptional regulator with XRE-family HTH domain|uniref:helix-turn-helix domain-containing protein n=1 Tax=Lactobacillus delbrueckii TaxID=1584 RepID=UPI0003311422|nr:helix-turn-helix transcriptional regulator [Lactobacillus delbrueckii]APG72520.1 transcriptional regulator [Lactobacillus delbrueckii subsp. jakobsenii ZN7a-9 = DSM 26046]EOD02977.1 transcriptional regulator [Lactobacillus delbrueckii subsp. jakobsenii ZN7a-9 = DSM 26046]MCZ0777406.1 helix-turn-helix transcriptional regulator [Lactobacillus delbrueckii subsp. sunkii]MCZ0794610.1 helix-turn-helix transcriptional regulator [Lactobacillus delbrueckii]MDK8261980.1 helix-turn-helix transcription